MIVYHGTTMVIEKPDVTYSKDYYQNHILWRPPDDR